MAGAPVVPSSPKLRTLCCSATCIISTWCPIGTHPVLIPLSSPESPNWLLSLTLSAVTCVLISDLLAQAAASISSVWFIHSWWMTKWCPLCWHSYKRHLLPPGLPAAKASGLLSRAGMGFRPSQTLSQAFMGHKTYSGAVLTCPSQSFPVFIPGSGGKLLCPRSVLISSVPAKQSKQITKNSLCGQKSSQTAEPIPYGHSNGFFLLCLPFVVSWNSLLLPHSTIYYIYKFISPLRG